jgi:glucose-6-phosphate dehydrogenase assembly protein OpcA
MSAPPGPLVSSAPRPVNVAAIERELAQLWQEPHADAEASQPTVSRAVMSNLMVFCATREEAAALPGELAEIVHQHPARVLLLVGDPTQPKDELDAFVSAHCHFSGGGRQVASEQVTLSAMGRATRRLPSAVRSLLLGDLPTAIWWAAHSAPPLGGELFQELSVMVDQVIYESVSWPDPVRGMVATAQWAGERKDKQVADLQWRRLKRWRRIISQALAPEVVPDALTTITEVYVAHGPHSLPQAWMLVGWLAARLGWQPASGRVKSGAEISWGFQSDHGPVKITIHRLSEGETRVQSVAITWKSANRPRTATFSALNNDRVQAQLPEREPRVLLLPSKSRASIVARQLPDMERDPIFAETLQHSGRMASALL